MSTPFSTLFGLRSERLNLQTQTDGPKGLKARSTLLGCLKAGDPGPAHLPIGLLAFHGKTTDMPLRIRTYGRSLNAWRVTFINPAADETNVQLIARGL
jgi:hypothetical protein